MLSALRRLGLLLGLLASVAIHALDVPYLTGRVTDNAELLDAGVRQQLSARLEAHERKTGNQIAVLTLPSLEGENLEDYSNRVFRAWGLGQKNKNNGVLLLIAPAERKLRIEVGYGLEGVLTDLQADRIIRQLITPAFRENNFGKGITEGVNAMIALLEGESVAELEVGQLSGTSSSRDSFFQGPDLSLGERILMGGFIFGIIGLFTFVALLTPGVGWFLYFFLIPFWAMFPIIVLGTTLTLYVFGTYLVGFPILKLILSRMPWYTKVSKDLKAKGRANLGGFVFTSGGRSGSSSWSSGSSGGGFSGGGGSSGGGGASGSW